MRRRVQQGSSVGARLLTPRQVELLGMFDVEGNAASFRSKERIPDWAAVKEVFLLLGAEWKRGGRGKDGSFVFPEGVDGAAKLQIAVEAGEVLDPKAVDFYPTPDELANRLVELAEIPQVPGVRVLEPSAGRGAIARAVRRARPRATVDVVEVITDFAAELSRDGFEPIARDFLAVPAPSADDERYDAVVMNPPFCGRKDVEHVRHALRFLKVGGSLVSVMSAGVAFRDDRVGRDFRAHVDLVGGRFEALPDGSFREAGTMVRTVALVVPRA